MNNKQLMWARTFLIAYKYLGALCSAIDRLVDTTAENSFFASGIWSETNSIYNVSSRILALSRRKIDYINLKVIVDKVLKKMPKKQAKFLILKYIEQLSPNDIATIMRMSTRSYFRNAKTSLQQFADVLEKIDFKFDQLEKRYLDDEFVASIFEKVCTDAKNSKEDSKPIYNDTEFKKYLRVLKRCELVEVIV